MPVMMSNSKGGGLIQAVYLLQVLIAEDDECLPMPQCFTCRHMNGSLTLSNIPPLTPYSDLTLHNATRIYPLPWWFSRQAETFYTSLNVVSVFSVL